MPPASPYHPTKGQKTNQSTTITLSPSIVRCKAHSINNPINEESASESITTNNNKTVIKILNAMILPKKKKKSLTHNTTLVTSTPTFRLFWLKIINTVADWITYVGQSPRGCYSYLKQVFSNKVYLLQQQKSNVCFKYI